MRDQKLKELVQVNHSKVLKIEMANVKMKMNLEEVKKK